MEELFAHEDEFPLANFVVLGGEVESIVDSSLSCESSGKVLIWDFSFQYDSYLSVWCWFELLAYYWVPSRTRLAFGMVDCCELSLGSGLTREFYSRLASNLWLGDVM